MSLMRKGENTNRPVKSSCVSFARLRVGAGVSLSSKWITTLEVNPTSWSSGN